MLRIYVNESGGVIGPMFLRVRGVIGFVVSWVSWFQGFHGFRSFIFSGVAPKNNLIVVRVFKKSFMTAFA